MKWWHVLDAVCSQIFVNLNLPKMCGKEEWRMMCSFQVVYPVAQALLGIENCMW